MKLYPFQREGVDFLAGRDRAYLADEMGLGKTVQAIVASRQLPDCRTTVVCPASVRENWRREWENWGEDPRLLTVTSYSSLIRNPVPQTRHVILDEAHYCKTPSARRTRAALRLAAGADWAWLLSGTPVPNDPRELWPVVKALWPELPARYGIKNGFEWMDRWCVWSASDYGYRVYGLTDSARRELVPSLRSFMLRRRLVDIALELPPLRFDVQYLDKDPDLATKLEALGSAGDDEHMSTLRRILGEYKAPKIAAEIIREMEEHLYRDIVVLYHHRRTGEYLRSRFESCDLLVRGFDGSTPPTVRQAEIDKFQQAGGVFLAQQTAAGTGITLTRAHEVVLAEPSWSPEDNLQAIKRIHRIGQDSPCRARLFAVPGSLDEALMATLRRKSRMIADLVDGD